MKLIIHDLGDAFDARLEETDAEIISANGKYAPCQGCFGCWTKHPAQCYMKDSLHTVCRSLGRADEVVIITENCYGAFSPAVKNVLDRSIGLSTALCTYRGGEMHHTLRYGRRGRLTVRAYGSMTPAEEATFRLMTERNALNFGFRAWEFHHTAAPEQLEEMGL